MAVFTLCFSGTACFTDEGQEGGTNPGLYGAQGYIPVRVYNDITASADQGKGVIPGPGEPWGNAWRTLYVPHTVSTNATLDGANGSSMWDLAGHGACFVVGIPSTGRGDAKTKLNKAEKALVKKISTMSGADVNPGTERKPPSCKPYQFSFGSLEVLRDAVYPNRAGRNGKITTINMIGHSRGGVAAIMASHELYYLFPDAQVNIFAIDPVPGSGSLNKEMVALAPNVKNYVGVYAADEASNCFNAVAPWFLLNSTSTDPLAVTAQANERISPPNYHLIWTRGRHGTIAGNHTSDGKDDAGKRHQGAALVGKLVGTLARACLKRWGSDVTVDHAHTREKLAGWQGAIGGNTALFNAMRGFYYPTQGSLTNWNERGITSASGSNPNAWHYLEDSIGIDPLVPRVSRVPDILRSSREQPGKVKWQSIVDLPESVFLTGKWQGDA